MPDVKTVIRYDGPNVDNKAMDIADLAPSLLSLSELIKDVNRKTNGKRAGIKVCVNADLEQNCFELVVHVTQSLFDTMTVLISDHKVVQAKEILEWIGIISAGVSVPFVTLYKLIKFLKGKQVESVTKIKNKESKFEIEIKAKDTEGNITEIRVSEHIYELYSSYETRKKAIEVITPLKKDGYTQMQFYNGKKIHEKFEKEDVPNIEDCPEVVPSNITRSDIKTVVRIRKPAYEGKSRWTLVYERGIEASIEDEEWLEKFQSNDISAPPNSSLKVDMIKEVVVNEHGEALDEPIYKVTKVHEVILPPDQLSIS
jgi:Fe2+ or Zn2+ uptake regulation protein